MESPLHGSAEVFPLPLFHVESSHRSLGRGCAQRITKRIAESNRYDAVQALNYLSGCDVSRPVNNSGAREHVLTRIKTAVYNFGTPDSSESVEAALQALLHSKSSYYEGPMGPAAFDCARLSLPDSAGGCKLVEVVGDDLRYDIQNFES